MSQHDLQPRVAPAWNHDADGPIDSAGPAMPGMGLLTIVIVALRYRVRIILLAVAFALLLAVPALLQPRLFTTTMAFTPQVAEGELARFSGVAAQLGLAVPSGGSAAQSPDFYASLVKSREILRHLATARFSPAGDPGRGTATLAELLEVEAPTPALRLDATIRRLEQLVAAGVNNKTGVISVAVTGPHPEVTRQVAESLLARVNDFNLRSRQSQASSERQFIEDRMTAVRRELRQSENELQAFRQSNRQVSSPELQMREQRLQQEVDLRRALFTSLAQSFEQTRIEEVRNTPAVNVIERPEAPVRPDSRRVVVKAALGILLGTALALLSALLQEAFRKARLRDEREFADFATLRHSVAEDIRHPIRALRRRR